MVNLVKVELRKILGKKMVLFSIVVFMLLTFFNVGYIHSIHNRFYRDYSAVAYSVLAGEVSQETLTNIRKLETNNPNNPHFLNALYEINVDVERQLNLSNQIDETVSLAKNNITLFGDSNYLQKIIDIYEGREITYIDDTLGWKNYFNAHYPTLFIIIILCISLSDIFSYEKEHKMGKLLVVSKLGTNKTVLAKLFASFGLTVILQIAFLVISLIAFSLTFGLSGSDIKIYTLKALQFSMFDFNFLQLFIVTNLIRLVGILSFVSLFLLISSYVKSSVMALGVSGGIFAFLTVIHDFISTSLNTINPIRLLQPISFFKGYDVITFGNYVISNLTFNLILYLLLILILTIILVRRGKRCF